jgi:hypothetical protein
VRGPLSDELDAATARFTLQASEMVIRADGGFFIPQRRATANIQYRSILEILLTASARAR